ncbi:MAG: DUF2341 domain-containing protein [Chitinophagales bacterium]|nr:DUF2341 domain-containing protein [Chitinophagales bacterium]
MKQNYKLLLLVVILIGIVNTASAQFLYTMPITVTNHENRDVLGWQVPMYINTAAQVGAGHMQSDGRDIRFSKDCAGTQLLNHFIDSGMNSTQTKIWVKMDTMYASAPRTIYMLYGNTSVSTASTYNTFNGPYTGTNSVTPPSTNTVSNCQRSMKFRANRDIIVSSFGKRTPDATTRYVTLFDFNSQAILRQMQVSGAAAVYSFQNLSNHIWLNANQDYILALYNGSGDMYYYGASGQSSQYITYGDMRYCNSCTENTFPTTVLTNNMYGVPDMEYYTVDTNNITNLPTYQLATTGSGNADITLGEMPYVCPGSSSAPIVFTATTGNPKEYDITWGATAANAGFANVVNAAMPSTSPITVVVPVSAPMGIYTGTLTMKSVCGAGKSHTITINVGGSITTTEQPKDTTVCPRDPASFSSDAKGPSIAYQWQVMAQGGAWTDLSNGGDYANVNTPKLTILQSQNAYNGNLYRCMVTSACALPKPSNGGKLIVQVDPIVSTQPLDVTTNPNSNVNFSVKTASKTATYQWQVASPNDVFVNINDGPIYSGVKTNNLLVRGVSYVQNGFLFRCLLFNSGSCLSPGDTSEAALLTVNPPKSVNDVSSQNTVIVYPNPTGGSELFIKADHTLPAEMNYKMIDKLGRIVSDGNLENTGITKIDITDLTPDVYFVEISDADGNRISMQKFTKL